MKSLHFGIRSGKRGEAIDHLAYITRKGSYASRDDLVDSGHGNMPSFASENPDLLWKASEKYERQNGSTFRSYTISLPNVLTTEQLKELALDQAHNVAGPKPFQYALHVPRSALQNELNPHIHIVVCDRMPDGIERSPEQMFRRYNSQRPESGGCKKDNCGRSPAAMRGHMTSLRKAAVDPINATLARHGHEIRFDHRTLREQGIERTPERYLGPAKIRKMPKAEREAYVETRRGRLQDGAG